MSRQVWIGMARVKPHSGNDVLEGATGAFVNVLALADNDAEWREATRNALEEIGLALVSAEDIEPFWSPDQRANPHEQLRDAAEQVRLTGEVRFGSFQAFDEG